MALTTQGFQLSALPRAPVIPANVGAVDVKEIYDGVRQGLASFEQMRRAPASMALADAETEAKTKAAPLQTAILAEQAQQAPLKTRQVLAQTTGVEQQTPLKTREEAARAKQMEAETTPEFLDAKLKHLLLTMNPSGVREFDLLTAGLEPTEKERARRIHFGLDPRQSSAAIQYKEIVGEDGKTRLVAVDPRGVGAQVIPTGERYGTGVSPPAPNAVTVTPVAAGTAPAPVSGGGGVATPGPSAFVSPSAGDKKAAEAAGAETAKITLENRAKLPKALATLETMDAKTKDVERDIDEATSLAGALTTGYGSLLKNLPATDARKLEALLMTIRANVGFDALTEMRKNSPTGGALGNVSDYEGKTLQSTIAALDQALKEGDLKEALRKVKEARREALTRVRNAYERDADTYGARGEKAATQAGEFKIVEIK